MLKVKEAYFEALNDQNNTIDLKVKYDNASNDLVTFFNASSDKEILSFSIQQLLELAEFFKKVN